VDAQNGFKDLLPETSITVELGLRRSSPLYSASAEIYNTRFVNRLVAITNCSGIVFCLKGVANVLSVTSRCVVVSFGLTP
ncbi:TonB-dependent receptor, partial [Pseudomonas syringae group genomosp. 7]|uniref:TonB-dependent receptor n=1 Tax=Pseudomonas syringae group genomosp. 7 TaxID=251699 RepID=UPI0037701A72